MLLEGLGFVFLKAVCAVVRTTCVTKSEAISGIYIRNQKQTLILFLSDFACWVHLQSCDFQT